jgi:hypothetical protein
MTIAREGYRHRNYNSRDHDQRIIRGVENAPSWTVRSEASLARQCGPCLADTPR